MYLCEGEVEPGDEAKVERLERKLSGWKRDVVRVGKKCQHRQEKTWHQTWSTLRTIWKVTGAKVGNV